MLAALLLVALAGCGTAAQDPEVATAADSGDTSSDATDAPAADVPDEERMRAFASCMRDNGVDMPDPQPGGPVRIGAGANRGDRDAMEKAMEACRSLMPNGGKPPELSPEDLEKARAMAACMREHGVDVPDPDPAGGGGIRIRRGAGEDGAPQVDEGALEEAMQACRHLGPQAPDGSDGGPRVSRGEGGGPGFSVGGSSGSSGSSDGSSDGDSDGGSTGGGG